MIEVPNLVNQTNAVQVNTIVWIGPLIGPLLRLEVVGHVTYKKNRPKKQQISKVNQAYLHEDSQLVLISVPKFNSHLCPNLIPNEIMSNPSFGDERTYRENKVLKWGTWPDLIDNI